MRDSANLIATRNGVDRVRRWLVAHYDAKAQGLSMAGKLGAMGYATTVMLLLTVLAVIRLRGPLDVDIVAGSAVLVLVACGILGRGALKGNTVGARDNASGLLAALTAAERSTDPGVGILLTGAQQFGLVGSRLFARDHGPSLPGAEVINLDTIDDRGRLRIWYHNTTGLGLANQVASLLAAGSCAGHPRRMPRVTAVDSVPLSGAGAAAVTVTRFDRSTLRRVHTPGDDRAGIEFTTAQAVGGALAGPI